MNGKHVILVLGCNDEKMVHQLTGYRNDCICASLDHGMDVFKTDEKIDNVVLFYLGDSETKCNPVEVVSMYFQCLKMVYREILVRRDTRVWFSLLQEDEKAPDRNIANAGIKSLAKTFGFEIEKRKIPVNCISWKENDTMDKILALLDYTMEHSTYLNLQTI